MNPKIRALLDEREELYCTMQDLKHNLRMVNRRIDTLDELLLEDHDYDEEDEEL